MIEERQKIIDWLNKVELEFDVEKLKIEDLHLWPILRWSIAKDFLDSQNYISENSDKNSSISKKHYFKRLINGAIGYFKLKLGLVENVDYVFVGASVYNVDFNNEKVNRFFHPINEILKKKNEKFLNASYSFLNENTDEDFKVLTLKEIFFFCNTVLTPFSSTVIKPNHTLNRIYESYKDEFGVQYNPKRFHSRVDKTLKWAKIFEQLIKTIGAKWYFGLCYYDPAIFGLNLACYRKNVISVDLQHGSQGQLHPAYSGFQKIPKNGYSSLPKIFWCWDTLSVNQLNDIFKETEKHFAFKGGHPWIWFLDNQKKIIRVRNSKNVLLYTMQPLLPLLTKVILDAISNTPDNFVWWIRFHPRMGKEDILEVKMKLKIYQEKGLIDYQLPNDLDLPSAIRSANLHITKSSGCFLEANLLGVPNLIIDKAGLIYYKSLIDNTNNFTKTEGNLWPLIHEILLIDQKQSQIEDLNVKLKELLSYEELLS